MGEKSQGCHGALLWGTGVRAASEPWDKTPCTRQMVGSVMWGASGAGVRNWL